MLDSTVLKKHLADTSVLSAEQLSAATENAATKSCSLDESIVQLKLMDHSKLGKSYSGFTKLPYTPIGDNQNNSALEMMSGVCAQFWKVFPHSFNAENNLLTLAVHDPGQIPHLEQINLFLMQAHSLAFTIASQSEVEMAIQQAYFGVEQTKIASSDSPPTIVRSRKVDSEKRKLNLGSSKKQKTPEPGKKAAVLSRTKPGSAPSKPQEDAGSTIPYPEMSKAVTAATALLARQHLNDAPDQLADVETNVRYCQLISSRMELPPLSVDAIINAGWMTAFDDKPEVIHQLVSPYHLDKILIQDESSNEEPLIEASILSLVRCFQALKRSEPEAAKDVMLTRRKLRTQWAGNANHQDVLETFLQVLMDEEFLSTLDSDAGTILLIDPTEASNSSLTPALGSHGYQVHLVPDARSADAQLEKSLPDAILMNMDLPGEQGLAYCERLKTTDTTKAIPIVILVPEDKTKRAADCLHAGADDFHERPVQIELLLIRLQRLMVKPQSQTGGASGVSGSLSDMGYTDMIQILCAGSKSVTMELNGPHGEGRVFIREGDVIHAEVGAHRGNDAFYSMMSWNEGDFSTHQCTDFPEQTIHESMMSLLMEGARWVDEGITA